MWRLRTRQHAGVGAWVGSSRGRGRCVVTANAPIPVLSESDSPVFAHTWKDGLLVLLALLSIGLVLFGASAFEELSWPWLVGLGTVIVFLNCTNYQCVAHNFLHNPFFRWEPLNALFSVVNSIALGMPQTLYKYHHLNHHQFNNDAQHPVKRTTDDRSSTYRYSQVGDREEHIVPYSFLGPLRMELGILYQNARAKRRSRLVWLEAAGMLAFSGTLAVIYPAFFLQFVLPTWFLGQVAALAENYLEHHHAVPGNRLTDSVSCYSRLYNWIWFNNGYHQEHHYRPTIHWTRIPAVRSEMLPETERRVVRGAHLFNFGKPPAPPPAVVTEAPAEKIEAP